MTMGKRGPKPTSVLSVGQTVGELTVIAEQEGSTVTCRCSCGTVKVLRAAELRRARPIRTCGHSFRTPTLRPPLQIGPGECQCCEAEATTRGLCSICYSRAKARGVLDSVALEPSRTTWQAGPSSPFWKGEAVDYEGAHKRITRARGRASNQKCAEPWCNRQAVNWSYDGYCPGERVCPTRQAPYCYHYFDHYQARCIPCHREWDRDQDIVAQAS